MSRKRRSVSDFGKVASDSTISNDTRPKNKNSIIEDVLKSSKTKEQTHTYKGFYLENEVADTIDRITEGKGRGMKSEIVNRILKNHFKEEGIL